MAVERLAREEAARNQPPTTLHLFNIDASHLRTTQGIVGGIRQLSGEYQTAVHAHQKLFDAKCEREERLEESMGAVSAQSSALESSETYGAVFLKLHNELSSYNPPLTPEEFKDLFRRLSAMNLEITKVLEDNYVRSRNTDVNIISGSKHAVARYQGNPPRWFHGDKGDWFKFLYDRGEFGYYLYTPAAIRKDLVATYPRDKDGLRGRGYTYRNGEPDWMDEEGLPSIEIVQKEMEEDHAERIRLHKQELAILNQQEFIEDFLHKRFVKAAQRFQERVLAVLQPNHSFSGTSGFLNFMYSKALYDTTTKPISEMKDEAELEKYIMTEDKLREYVLRQFAADPKRVLGIEAVALWLERQMLDDKLIATANDILTGDTALTLDRLLGEDQVQKGDLPKKMFYDVRSLVLQLSPEERDHLRQLAGESRGSQIEYMIWAIAERISSRLQQSPPTEQKAVSAANGLKDFSVRWMRRNFGWAAQEMERVAAEGTTITFTQVEEEADDEESIEVVAPGDSAQEYEETLSYGNLQGWKLFVIPEVDVPRPEMISIPDGPLAEREKWLERFVQTHKIGHDKKMSTIVNALDWLVVVPPESAVRAFKMVRGQKYGKLKEGTMRILFQLDQENKQLSFYLHKKKEWTYGF